MTIIRAPCLLCQLLPAAEYFYTKVQHLNWMLESVAADIRQPNHSDTDSQAAVDKAHQLLPIQKFLTSLKNDVKETGDAIKAVRFSTCMPQQPVSARQVNLCKPY